MADGTLDAQVWELTDEDLHHVLECECQYLWLWEFYKAKRVRAGLEAGRKCRQPAAARLRISCRNCGAGYLLFLCRVHAAGFRKGRRLYCRVCGTGGTCRGTDS